MIDNYVACCIRSGAWGLGTAAECDSYNFVLIDFENGVEKYISQEELEHILMVAFKSHDSEPINMSIWDSYPDRRTPPPARTGEADE